MYYSLMLVQSTTAVEVDAWPPKGYAIKTLQTPPVDGMPINYQQESSWCLERDQDDLETPIHLATQLFQYLCPDEIIPLAGDDEVEFIYDFENVDFELLKQIKPIEYQQSDHDAILRMDGQPIEQIDVYKTTDEQIDVYKTTDEHIDMYKTTDEQIDVYRTTDEQFDLFKGTDEQFAAHSTTEEPFVVFVIDDIEDPDEGDAGLIFGGFEEEFIELLDDVIVSAVEEDLRLLSSPCLTCQVLYMCQGLPSRYPCFQPDATCEDTSAPCRDHHDNSNQGGHYSSMSSSPSPETSPHTLMTLPPVTYPTEVVQTTRFEVTTEPSEIDPTPILTSTVMSSEEDHLAVTTTTSGVPDESSMALTSTEAVHESHPTTFDEDLIVVEEEANTAWPIVITGAVAGGIVLLAPALFGIKAYVMRSPKFIPFEDQIPNCEAASPPQREGFTSVSVEDFI